MSRSLHRLARSELAAAFRFYRQEAGIRIAERFLDEFERIVQVIEHCPELGTPAGEGQRSYPMHDFPYSVIYSIKSGALRILVVRHQHRDPSHGAGRS